MVSTSAVLLLTLVSMSQAFQIAVPMNRATKTILRSDLFGEWSIDVPEECIITDVDRAKECAANPHECSLDEIESLQEGMYSNSLQRHIHRALATPHRRSMIVWSSYIYLSSNLSFAYSFFNLTYRNSRKYSTK